MPSISLMRRKLQGYSASNETVSSDLRFAQAQRSNWYGIRFGDAELGAAVFAGSTFTRCEFTCAEAELVDFGNCTFIDCTFDDCDLGGSMFINAVIRDVTFNRCDLVYGSFAGATIRVARFFKCNLHGADLDFIENNSCSFMDCNLWGAKASIGCQFYNSHFDDATCRRFVAMVARRFPPGEDRRKLTEIAGKHFATVDRLMRERLPEGDEKGTAEPEEPVAVETELEL